MKFLPFLLSLVVTFFFSGCGGESTTSVYDANDSAAVETSTPNVPVTPKLPPLASTIELAGAETQPFAYFCFLVAVYWQRCGHPVLTQSRGQATLQDHRQGRPLGEGERCPPQDQLTLEVPLKM